MSLAYRSWEVPTTPTVAFKGLTKGAHEQQDGVIQDLSPFTLFLQSQPQSEPCVIDGADGHALSGQNLQNTGSSQTGYMIWPDHLSIEPSQFVCSERILEKSSEPSPSISSLECVTYNSTLTGFQNVPDASVGHCQHSPELGFLSEDRPWKSSLPDSEVVESDCVSSCSSISADSPCTSGDGSEVVSGESDAHSPYKGPLDCMSSLEAALPVRRGLSRFFVGQSRSFSCLADVVSIKDLAKPENPYARKRKSFAAVNGSFERPRLFPLRNGSGIKKPPHNNKSTLALAVAMSTRESILDRNELDCHVPVVPSTIWQSDSVPPRSFSFSDFQRPGCRLSPGSS